MDATVRTTIATPVGEMILVAGPDALLAARWRFEEPAPLGGYVDPAGHQVLSVAVAQLQEYFDGRRTEFDVPISPAGTPFQQAAWDVLRTIPFGATMSYREQAARLGDRGKARAVGAANGRNPLPIIVPCHRVIGSNGHLTGFAAGTATKAWLLDHEQRVLISG